MSVLPTPMLRGSRRALASHIVLGAGELWVGSAAVLISDVQGFEKPLGYKGKGKEGRGQGTDFEILNKPPPPLKGQGFLLKG